MQQVNGSKNEVFISRRFCENRESLLFENVGFDRR
jgi:hypothetical protein